MFGFFGRKNPVPPVPLKELAQPQDNGFSAQEIGTINGAYAIIRQAVYDLGGEVPGRWNETFSTFEERAPNGTLAQAWIVREFCSGLTGGLVGTSHGAQMAYRIGRTYLSVYPNALSSIVARSCAITQEAFNAYLERLDGED